MVFEDRASIRPKSVRGVKYTKAPLELNDLYARVVSDEATVPLAQDILSKYGYDKATTTTQLAHKLAAIVMNAGEPALKDIAQIHPDRDLILSFCAPAQGEPVTIVKEVIKEVPVEAKPASKQNAEGSYDHDCGCGGHHSAEGGHHHSHRKYRYDTAEPLVVYSPENKYLKPVMLISATAIACFLIWKL